MANMEGTQLRQILHRRTSFTASHVSLEDRRESLENTSASRDVIESSLEAWLCVLGAFTFAIPSYGFMQSVGTVQSFLQLNQLNSYSSGEIGWITGIYLFLSYFCNIQIGPICDHYGPIPIGSIGVLITISSFILLAECQEYWHFMLCLGFLTALGGAIVATVGMAAVAKVFDRRRGLAMGIALTGSSIGSIIIPLMLRATLPKYGWQWSMRIMGFVIAGLTLPGLLCFLPFRRLLPVQPNRIQRPACGAVLDFSALRSYSFAYVTIGQFFLEFAIFGIAGLLPTVAISAGFPPQNGFTLIAVLSACSCLGRVLFGILGDLIGHFNTFVLIAATTLIAMGALFVPFVSKSIPILYAFAGLWGFTSGPFLSINAGMTCEPRNYGRYFGTMTFLVSFAVLLSVPLGGMMLDNMGSEPLAGLLTSIVFVGGAFYAAARATLIGKWWGLKTKI